MEVPQNARTLKKKIPLKLIKIIEKLNNVH
jgi:hypothetical protein